MDPVTVQVLILTDDDGSYTQEHRFGLSELVSILRTQVKPPIKLEISSGKWMASSHEALPAGWNEPPRRTGNDCRRA